MADFAQVNESNWWKTLFDQKYLDAHLGELTLERTTSEADFLVEATRLRRSERVLDLACGQGRHAIELARRGLIHLTGIDYSRTLLAKAAGDAARHDVRVRLAQGDMRALPFTRAFDVVFSFFTALGYFDDDVNQAVLEQVYGVLALVGGS